jgi:hypothetical protein
MGRRDFGYLRRLPSKRNQASYVGPDLARHVGPTTFRTKGDAETWLTDERRIVESASGDRRFGGRLRWRGQPGPRHLRNTPSAG